MTIGEAAQVNYIERQIRLDDEARRQQGKGFALSARVVRNYARIAYNAAMAEMVDPEPESRQCSTCRGVRVCDITAHQARGWA